MSWILEADVNVQGDRLYLDVFYSDLWQFMQIFDIYSGLFVGEFSVY